MIIKVNKKIEAIKSDKELQLPEDLRKEIEKFWKEQKKEKMLSLQNYIL